MYHHLWKRGASGMASLDHPWCHTPDQQPRRLPTRHLCTPPSPLPALSLATIPVGHQGRPHQLTGLPTSCSSEGLRSTDQPPSRRGLPLRAQPLPSFLRSEPCPVAAGPQCVPTTAGSHPPVRAHTASSNTCTQLPSRARAIHQPMSQGNGARRALGQRTFL